MVTNHKAFLIGEFDLQSALIHGGEKGTSSNGTIHISIGDILSNILE